MAMDDIRNQKILHCLKCLQWVVASDHRYILCNACSVAFGDLQPVALTGACILMSHQL